MTDEEQTIVNGQLRTHLQWTRVLAILALFFVALGYLDRFRSRSLQAQYVRLNSMFESQTGNCVLAGSGDGFTLMFTDEETKNLTLGISLGAKDRQIVVRDGEGTELRRFSLDAN